MTTKTVRSFAAVLACAVVSGVALTARPALAGSEDTWRYVTYGAGAVTVYSAAKKKPLPAILGAAGTYLAYKKWQGEKNERQRDDRWDNRRGDRRYDDRRDSDYRRDRDRDDRYDNRDRRDRDYRDDDYRDDDRYERRTDRTDRKSRDKRSKDVLGDIFKGDRRSDRTGDVLGDILKRR